MPDLKGLMAWYKDREGVNTHATNLGRYVKVLDNSKRIERYLGI
jgi:hypothetical protein